MKTNKQTLGQFISYIRKIENHRFENKQQLQKEMSQVLGFKVKLQNKQNSETDYCLICNLIVGDNEVYFDIYYIKDNLKQLYITEYGIDSEHSLSDSDYELFVSGNSL
jgi:hypothetical protein